MKSSIWYSKDDSTQKSKHSMNFVCLVFNTFLWLSLSVSLSFHYPFDTISLHFVSSLLVFICYSHIVEFAIHFIPHRVWTKQHFGISQWLVFFTRISVFVVGSNRNKHGSLNNIQWDKWAVLDWCYERYFWIEMQINDGKWMKHSEKVTNRTMTRKVWHSRYLLFSNTYFIGFTPSSEL